MIIHKWKNILLNWNIYDNFINEVKYDNLNLCIIHNIKYIKNIIYNIYFTNKNWLGQQTQNYDLTRLKNRLIGFTSYYTKVWDERKIIFQWNFK